MTQQGYKIKGCTGLYDWRSFQWTSLYSIYTEGAFPCLHCSLLLYVCAINEYTQKSQPWHAAFRFHFFFCFCSWIIKSAFWHRIDYAVEPRWDTVVIRKKTAIAAVKNKNKSDLPKCPSNMLAAFSCWPCLCVLREPHRRLTVCFASQIKIVLPIYCLQPSQQQHENIFHSIPSTNLL